MSALWPSHECYHYGSDPRRCAWNDYVYELRQRYGGIICGAYGVMIYQRSLSLVGSAYIEVSDDELPRFIQARLAGGGSAMRERDAP